MSAVTQENWNDRRRARKPITPTEAARHNLQQVLNRCQPEGDRSDPVMAKAVLGLRELMNTIQRQNALIESLKRSMIVGGDDSEIHSIVATVVEQGGEKELLVDGETFYKVRGQLPVREDRAMRSMCIIYPDDLIQASDGQNVCITIMTSDAIGVDEYVPPRTNGGGGREEEEEQ